MNIFLLFIFAIMEFGHFVMVKQLMDNAARDGARMASTGALTVTHGADPSPGHAGARQPGAVEPHHPGVPGQPDDGGQHRRVDQRGAGPNGRRPDHGHLPADA